jgi:fibronectin type 3 domain-containing protein
MAKPVAGDIDNDGHLDIFLASQDVSPGDNRSGTYVPNGYDGTIVRLDYQGNILATTFTWRACSGGLSLADTDNDGVFELYQGDRQAMSSPSRSGYSDGGYGKGVRSLWADNLTERWNRLDFLSSSQSPVLADVNGDGILDVLAGMYNEMNILNSTNGEMIQRWSTGRYDPISMSVHYGFTVYDIDDDGHLELFCSDGDHDNDPYVDVFDLVTGEFDAELSLAGGDWKWGPTIADISTSNLGMEIICAPNGTTINGWRGVLMIYNSDFESIQNVTASMSVQLGYPFVQDIDGDTYLEVVVCASSGSVYAFDTAENAPAPTGSDRIRSEVTYFGEARLGVAEHTIMPWEDNYWTAPLVAPVSPGDNALAVPVTTDHVDFRLREHQSEPLSYTVSTSPDIGSGGGSNTSNSDDWSTYTLTFAESLDYDTTYHWTVSATDGTYWTNRTYTFRTEFTPNPGNHAPTQDPPSLVSQDGLNMTTSTFMASSQNTDDDDDDEVANTCLWMVDDDPVAEFLMTFNTRNETWAKDYAHGNDGEVVGAPWVPDGRVGGAYLLDGKDDFIIVSDGGLGYFDDHDYPDNKEELGGFGNWEAITVEVWIYLTEYNNGSKIVAKIPSYALGFYSGYTSRLYAAVWPYSGYVNPDNDNQNAEDREQAVSANVDIDLNTWYHIAFTYENGVGLKLYFNGQLVAEDSTRDGPLSRSRGEPLTIGRLVQPFAGMIDEVRIYSYAQPEEQIYSRYMESKDGNSSSSLFYPLGIGGPGDSLACAVIPTDSFEDGLPSTSSPITLVNTPPEASNLRILPERVRDFRFTSSDLEARYDYYDADGLAEQNSQIRWYKDTVLQSSFNDLTTVPSGSTAEGQEWYFTVTPRDSWGDFGSLQTSHTVTIIDNSAPTQGEPSLVSSAGTDREDEDLIARAVGTFDADGDNVTNTYHWIKDGTSLTNLLLTFNTESFAEATDQSGHGNDGTVSGPAWTEEGVVGGAYIFDGNGGINVAEQAGSLGGDGSWSTLSIEFWVKATENTNNERVIWLHNATDTRDVAYRLAFRAYSDSNYLRWRVYALNTTGLSMDTFSVDYNIPDGPRSWHHVVCTYELGVGLKIFVDGTEREFTPYVEMGSMEAVGNGILDIGYYSGSGDFVGLLDEVRLYPSVLSSAQIFQRFLETRDGSTDSSTIVAQETAAGDDWECEVIPNDSWEDGVADTSDTLTVLAVPGGQNSRPRIDAYCPVDFDVEVTEGETLNFTHVSSDPDDDPLDYVWLLEGSEMATSQNWTYMPGYADAGVYNVTLVISDGGFSDSQEWNVTVLEALLTSTYFDFGTGASPVESSYTAVSDSTLYSAPAGYGWASTAGLGARDRGLPDDLRRDLLFASVDRTFNIDVANGDYRVILVVGDQSYMHDLIDVYAEGILQVNDLLVASGKFAEVSFVVIVSDEQLNLVFHDDGGADANWVVNAVVVQPAPAPAGIQLDFGTGVSPAESGYTAVSESTPYSAFVGYGWASTAGLGARDRGLPDDLRCDLVFSGTDRTFNVDLTNGEYRVVLVLGDQSYLHDLIDVYAEGGLVVNDLTSAAGAFREVAFLVTVSDGQLNLLFHDDGGVDANWVVNALVVQPAPAPANVYFDLGTGASPVESGYTAVSDSTLYSALAGYGWASTAGLGARDRGVPDELRRDLVFASVDRAFSVDMANGEYEVTLLVGDQSYVHDLIDVYAEGFLEANDVSAAAGTFSEVVFTVTVSDGQLNLLFHDDGGADANWVINAIAVAPVP